MLTKRKYNLEAIKRFRKIFQMLRLSSHMAKLIVQILCANNSSSDIKITFLGSSITRSISLAC